MAPAQLLHLPHLLYCALQWGGQCWTSSQVFVCCWSCSVKFLPSQDGASAILYPLSGTDISRILSFSLFQWVGEVKQFDIEQLFTFFPLPVGILFVNKPWFFHFHLLVLISYCWNRIVGTLKETAHSGVFSFELSQTKTKPLLPFHRQDAQSLFLDE